MMKKFILSTILSLTFTLQLLGDLSSTLANMQKVECDVEMIAPSRDHLHGFKTFPLITVKQGTSTNWSGYAALTNLNNPQVGSVSKVSGSWMVPTVSPSAQRTFCSIWVGIDGYKSGTVEQIGTEHDWNQGRQVNYAWFEMYPRAMYKIVDFAVDVNDHIGAEVTYVGNNNFQLTIANYTKNIYTIVPARYTRMKRAKRSSAEWIVEAPSSLNGVLPLANFGVAFLSNCLATINGINGAINNGNWQHDAITMVTRNQAVKAQPSALSGDGQSFQVQWMRQ